MKINFAFSGLVAAAFLTLSSGSAIAQNSLLNSGFETGDLTSWNSGSGGFVTSDQSHSGKYSFAAMGDQFVLQNFVAHSVSNISELSFWVKRQGGPFDSFGFFYSDGSTGNTLVNGISQSNDWMFFDLTSKLDVTKSLVGIKVYGTSPGPAYLDDFKLTSVTAVPEPETYSMLLAGVALMATVARRRKSKHSS